MVLEEEYHITFPKCEADFIGDELNFSINHIKSRLTSTLYFIFRAYDMNDELIHTYISDRWIIDNVYKHKDTTFHIPQNVVDNTAKFQLEIVSVGTSSENPLWFNEVMFQEGEFVTYHTPKEAVIDWEVKFNKSSHAILYNMDGNSLQVIRPQRDSFLTNRLTKSNCTVLAPHLENESSYDNSTNVFLEFINQTEQRIDVLR